MSAPEAAATPAGSIRPGPRPVNYRVPSFGHRLTIGLLQFFLLVIALVVIPVAMLGYLQSLAITLPVSVTVEVAYGLALSVLLAARYVVRPTRAYGPVSMAVAAVTIVFFVTLIIQATYRFNVPQTTVAISIVYVRFFELLLLVPVFSLLAGLVTTIEDIRSPTERLPFDYPL